MSKFFAWNGALTLLHNNTNGFNAHLLIGFHEAGIIKNLSFSFGEMVGQKTTVSMFTLSFPEASQNIDITFCSGKIHYCRSTAIPKNILEKISKSTLSLYLHIKQETKDNPQNACDPKHLLKNLSNCAEAYAKILKALHGTDEVIKEFSPKFIESLTNTFNEGLENLMTEKASLKIFK